MNLQVKSRVFMNRVKKYLLMIFCQTHHCYSASSEMHKYYVIKMITIKDGEVLVKLICTFLAGAIINQ